jgi:hypothetical protein
MLLPLFSLAQSNYKPGYIVTLKGDTVRGFVNYKEWNANPNSIDFKTANAVNGKKYLPAEIHYFSIDGQESYRQYTGPVSMDYTDPGHISNSRDTSFKVETVFLKVIQKGSKLALYSFADNIKLRFFIAESPKYNLVELGYRLYSNFDSDAANNQKGTTVNENTYMRQLFALSNKYQVQSDDFQWQIEHSEYNKGDLLKIVSKINHISKADYEKSNTVKGPKSNFFVGAAVNIDNMSAPASSAYVQGGGTGHTSYKPAVFFGINFFANPSTRQLQFRLELSAAQSQFKSLYALKVSPYVPFKASFDKLTFTFAPQIIYNFYNAENLKIYGGAGIALCYFNFSNPYLGSQEQPNSATDIEQNNPYYFNKIDDTFILKAGVQIHESWGIFAQYMTSVLDTKGGYFGMNSTVEQVGINYFFK